MIVWRRISTFSRLASSAAFRSGRTLNPMMIAFEAAASSTSVSVIAPTLECMMRTLHIALQDQWNFFHFAFGQLLVQLIECESRSFRHCDVARLVLTVLR